MPCRAGFLQPAGAREQSGFRELCAGRGNAAAVRLGVAGEGHGGQPLAARGGDDPRVGGMSRLEPLEESGESVAVRGAHKLSRIQHALELLGFAAHGSPVVAVGHLVQPRRQLKAILQYLQAKMDVSHIAVVAFLYSRRIQ